MGDKPSTVTYKVTGMRVTFPKGKVAAKHPDRFATVHGIFSDAKGNRLSIVSKNVTREEARDGSTVIDPARGMLTLPAGERGRKPEEGETPDAVNAALNALRNPEVKAEA